MARNLLSFDPQELEMRDVALKVEGVCFVGQGMAGLEHSFKIPNEVDFFLDPLLDVEHPHKSSPGKARMLISFVFFLGGIQVHPLPFSFKGVDGDFFV